jgi:hypothetical protein
MDLIQRYRNGQPENQEIWLIDSDLTSAWRGLTYLVRRPWFTRRWVMQEIALSSSSMIYCGTKSTTWAALYLATCTLNSETHKLLIHRESCARR